MRLRAIFLSLLLSVLCGQASADYPGDWSGFVTITTVSVGSTGEFIISAPNAPNPGSCGGYYRVYLNQMGVSSTFGIEMLYRQAMTAVASDKQVSIFRSNDSLCYVHSIELKY